MVNTEGFFDDIFRNARENSIIIMDEKGHILEINKGFSKAFGYRLKELVGKHFNMLFTKEDQLSKKPEKEIKYALASGSKSDNNYLVHKNGHTIWVMGESVFVKNTANEKYIVKTIQDIHAQKQLERFLLESSQVLDTIFDSIKDVGLVVLDSSMKILKANKAFLKLFEETGSIQEGMKLSQLQNSFWRTAAVKSNLMTVLLTNKPLKKQIFYFKVASGKEKAIEIEGKLMESSGKEKRILIVIKTLKNAKSGVSKL